MCAYVYVCENEAIEKVLPVEIEYVVLKKSGVRKEREVKGGKERESSFEGIERRRKRGKKR